MSAWADITKDPKTGHTIAKDLFKAIAFYAGVVLCFIKAGADVHTGREVSAEPALFLLGFALGAQGLKLYEMQQNRRTTDEAGNALAQPGTADPPSSDAKLMPQATKPNDAEETRAAEGDQETRPGQTLT